MTGNLSSNLKIIEATLDKVGSAENTQQLMFYGFRFNPSFDPSKVDKMMIKSLSGVVVSEDEKGMKGVSKVVKGCKHFDTIEVRS